MNNSETSSQENLPLSQETLLKTLSSIPNDILDIFMKTNFDADLSTTMMEEPDPKQFGEMMSIESSHIINTSQASIPSTENLPGCFDFNVSTGSENSKKCRYTYSPIVDKLYVKLEADCPFQFRTNQVLDGFVIRAMLYFCSPEHRARACHRCVHHDNNDQKAGDVLHQHFIRCNSKSANYYEEVGTKRTSVTVNYENPGLGESYTTYLYRFTCYTSCVGGPNRQPMCVVFTLEKNGEPYGRCKVNIKICSDPLRDKISEESKFEEKKSRSLTTNKSSESLASILTRSGESFNQLKRKRDEDKRYIQVSGEEEYKFLKSMQRFYHMRRLMTHYNWSPTKTDMHCLLRLLSSNSYDDSE